MTMALEGIRVVDMTVWHHGPGGGTFLADMGAEVIKVEERLSGDPGRHGGSLGGVENEYGLSYYFENNNRDKKSLAINLKTEKGHEVITRLLKKSDIFLSNMRKSGLGRLGLSYEEVKEINPDIIYAHGSGQGDQGPLLNRQSNDIIGQFWGGYVSYGSAEGPMSIWSDFADRGGAVMLAYGAALALLGRERHGISQEVNTSLLGGQVHLGAINFQQQLFEGKAVSPLSNGDGHLPNPFYNIYQDRDGAWLCIGAEGTDEDWGALCEVLGTPGLESDPRFDSQVKRTNGSGPALYELIRDRFAEETIDHWRSALDSTFIPWAPLRNYNEVLSDPHVLENEFVADLEHPNKGTLKYVGLPVRLSKTPGKLRMPAPDLGQHTEEILTEICDYSWDEVIEMKIAEVVN